MPDSEILIPSSTLTSFAQEILHSAGVAESKARLVAASLVAANLRGVDSHGVQLLPYYVQQIERGHVFPAADGHIVSENGGCILYDGEHGLGQHISDICCDHVTRLARKHGIAIVVARESNHFGAAAWWAQKIARAGQIGIVMCDASPIVPPWQAKETRLGTNPICVALPGPWLLDMATTTVAANRIFKAAINKQPTIPAGWAMDREGVPTTDTLTALDGLIMPLGGYKGTGLAMMVEILCGVLSGGAMCMDIGGIRIPSRMVRTNQTFIAIDIERFMPVAEFTARVERLVELVKSAKPATGYDEVLVAGDPEWRSEAQRLQDGIPLGRGTWQSLLEAAQKYGVSAPAVESC
jgi:LDH2 family malate/lactate/ureidoglycolate dehydrogenase